MQRKFLYGIVIIVALGIGYYWLVFSRTTAIERVSEKTVVKTDTTIMRVFQEKAQFSGFIGGVRQTDVTAKTSGYVMKLLKEEGETVRQGEIVAVLDGSELLATQKSALLSLGSIDSALKASKRYYDQKVNEAETALDQASGSSAKATAEEVLKSTKRLRDAEQASLNIQRMNAEGQVVVSSVAGASITIRAPFSGIITRKDVSIGSFVTPGMPIYSLASDDALEVVIVLPMETARRVAKNSRVVLSDTVITREGYVFSIVSSAERDVQHAVARIRFASPSDQDHFPLGTYVQVSLVVGPEKESLFIPLTALLSQYDDTFVYVVENGVAKKQAVKIGSIDGQHQEIISGLTAGTQVAVEGVYTLSDNQPVTEHYDAQ